MRYSQFKVRPTGKKTPLPEQELDEVAMSSGALKQFLSSPAAEGIRAGFEAEVIFADVLSDTSNFNGESEPDYDSDETAYDIDQIAEFFAQGSESRGRVRGRLLQSYDNWFALNIPEQWDREQYNDIRQWIIDNDIIDGNPGDDGYGQKVSDRADKAIADEDEVYNAAHKEFREYFNDNPPDEMEWLRDMGWDTMQDVGEEFNLSWPHWTTSNDSNGDGEFDSEKAQELADDFADWFGVPTKVGNYHNVPRNDTDWIFEADGSLTPDELEDMPVEIISPPMPLAKTVDMLGEFFNWAKSNKAYTNSSTGFHMSVSLPGQEVYEAGEPPPEKVIDFVKLALFLGDKHVLKQFGREANRFAASAVGKLQKAAIRPNDASPSATGLAAMKEFRAGMMSAASKALSSSRGFGKYTSINPKSGYVEFRSAGGEDYFGDIPLLKNTLMRYAYALSIAGDPAAEKKEYSKKMYKLLTNVQTRKTTDPKGGRTRTEPVQDVSKDAIALFSSYMSGELPKSSLKNYIKQIQNSREIAKNPSKEKIQWQVRHPNGAAMITVMATSAEEAIQIAKKEYNDQRNPDDAYSAIPVLISPPGDEDDDPRGTEYVIRNRGTGSNANSGTGPVLYRFTAVSTADAIATTQRWAESRGQERHHVWLSPASVVPPEILSATPLRVRTTVGEPRPAFQEPHATAPLSNWTVWAVSNPGSTVTATGHYEDDAITDALWNPANQEWAYGHGGMGFRAIRAPNADAPAARRNTIPEVPLDIAQNFQDPPASWDGGSPIQTEPQNFPAARSSATGGEFTGLWRVVSGVTGEVLHTFVFRSNDQTVADRVAADWARRTGFDDPVQATPVYRTPGTRT
jgi:hypothetical protein